MIEKVQVYRRCSVVMCYALFGEIAPYFCVVDFAETDVHAAYGCDAPGEGPACAVKHRECPEIFADACSEGCDAVEAGFNDVG
jgi:hypothetical protein